MPKAMSPAEEGNEKGPVRTDGDGGIFGRFHYPGMSGFRRPVMRISYMNGGKKSFRRLGLPMSMPESGALPPSSAQPG